MFFRCIPGEADMMNLNDPQLSRTRRLLGAQAMEKLENSHVAVFGLGGVGGNCAEALLRCGVGHLTLVDGDRVSLSNLNRQIFATRDTVGMDKTDAALRRLRSIRPECDIRTVKAFVLPENIGQFDFSLWDCAVDCVDTVAAKMAIIEAALAAGTRVISCMGTGNKLDPAALRIGDIYSTSVCPLARVMRTLCRKRGIPSLKVVWSAETPLVPREEDGEEAPQGKHPPASISFVPPAAGYLLASAVVRDLTDGLQ